ncbi:hypothetical protein SLE2022_277220 [Rubroshorea leprosula]
MSLDRSLLLRKFFFVALRCTCMLTVGSQWLPTPLSSMLTCYCLVWCSLIPLMSQRTTVGSGDSQQITGLDILDPPVPEIYFGNCVGAHGGQFGKARDSTKQCKRELHHAIR